jgi:hypothetical protein
MNEEDRYWDDIGERLIEALIDAPKEAEVTPCGNEF